MRRWSYHQLTSHCIWNMWRIICNWIWRRKYTTKFDVLKNRYLKYGFDSSFIFFKLAVPLRGTWSFYKTKLPELSTENALTLYNSHMHSFFWTRLDKVLRTRLFGRFGHIYVKISKMAILHMYKKGARLFRTHYLQTIILGRIIVPGYLFSLIILCCLYV